MSNYKKNDIGSRMEKALAMRMPTNLYKYPDTISFLRDKMPLLIKKKPIFPHLQLLNNHIMRYQKSLIEFPRGHFKSTFLTYQMILWILYENHNSKILIVRQRADEAAEAVKRVKKTIEENPQMGIKPSLPWATDVIQIERDNYDDEIPTLKGVGFEGGITGGHYDWIFMDDVESRETTLTSDSINKHIQTLNTVYLALDTYEPGEAETKFVYICTPKQTQDLSYHLEQNPSWAKLILPAITKNGEPAIPPFKMVKDENGVATDIEITCSPEELKEYKVLCPEKRDIQYLLRKMISTASDEKRDMSYRDWKMEYLLIRPSPTESPFRPEFLTYYDDDDLKKIIQAGRKLHIFLGIDLATSTNPKNRTSHTVILAGGVDIIDKDTKKLYVLDYFYERVDPVSAIPIMRRKIDQWCPEQVYVESNAYQLLLKLMLEQIYVDRVTSVYSLVDKNVRICQLGPLYQNGKIAIRRDMKDLIREYKAFDPSSNKNELDIHDAIDFICRNEMMSTGVSSLTEADIIFDKNRDTPKFISSQMPTRIGGFGDKPDGYFS